MKLGGSGKEGGYYEIPFGLYEGVNGDIKLGNNPETFITLDYRYNVPEGINEVLVIPWMQTHGDDAARVFISDGPDGTENERLLTATSLQQTVFLQPPPVSDFPWQGFSQTLHPRSMTPTRLLTHAASETMLNTAPVYVDVNGDVTFGPNGEAAFVENGVLEINAGGGLARWAGWLDVSSTRLQLREQPNGAGFFVDQWGTMTAGTFAYSLFDEDERFYSDSLRHVPQVPVVRRTGSKRIEIESGSYRMVVEGAQSGRKSSVEMAFRTDLADPSPPRIEQLAIKKDGRFVDRLQAGTSYEIIATLTDMCRWCESETAWERVANVAISIRTASDTTWHAVHLDTDRGEYRGVLPDTLKPGAYDLQLWSVDVSGNTLTYFAEAALEMGQVQRPVLVYPTLGAEVSTEAELLIWSSPGAAALFHVQLSRDATFDQIDIEADALMETSLPLPPLEPGSRYFWRVRLASTEGAAPWSTVRWFSTPTLLMTDEGPARFEVRPLYPNPANQLATLQYDLPEMAQGRHTLYDALGRRQHVVSDAMQESGTYKLQIPLEQLPGGMYFLLLEAGIDRSMQSVIVVH